MPLYLTGGGEQEDFKGLDRLFLEKLPKGAGILLVPLAVDEDEYEDALLRVEECFGGSSKVDKIELCEDVNKYSFDDLKGFDAVFLEGGNTFQLIQAVRQTSFFDNLEQFLLDGGHIYADSAGAIVLGAHVRTAFLGEDADEDFEKLQDYRGLNLIEPYAVHCHHESSDQDSINDLMYETGTPILALAEPCGVFIEAGKLKVFGKAHLEIFTFTGMHKILVGSEVDLETVGEE